VNFTPRLRRTVFFRQPALRTCFDHGRLNNGHVASNGLLVYRALSLAQK
jgi:hypothetical protein